MVLSVWNGKYMIKKTWTLIVSSYSFRYCFAYLAPAPSCAWSSRRAASWAAPPSPWTASAAGAARARTAGPAPGPSRWGGGGDSEMEGREALGQVELRVDTWVCSLHKLRSHTGRLAPPDWSPTSGTRDFSGAIVRQFDFCWPQKKKTWEGQSFLFNWKKKTPWVMGP